VIYSLDSVSKFYAQGPARTGALDCVSLRVERGEHVALLGQSGAGKSTLFRLLNATIRPSSGLIHFEGRDVAAMSGAEIRGMRRRIGTVYQQHNLVPSLSALDNTLTGGLGRWSLRHTLRGMVHPCQADVEQALEALASVGLADRGHARADELSGGQQQRVAIARALMQDPDVILADEPVASLDPGLAGEIIALLAHIAAEGNRTLIVALHTVELALETFPRLVGLRAGSIEFDLPSDGVNDDLLKKLYSSPSPVKKQAQDERGFQTEFRCIS
jgi:phosphonate transport system ATP-binding protein